MSFFVDPTISTLTSGTPSQNVDLAGVSFPRRLGFRLASDFADKFHLIGKQAVWQAYSDPSFSEESSLGSEFHHEGLIDRTRWVRMYFKGIFPKNVAYLKCIIRDTQTGMHIKSFYFKFEKAYQTSLSGRTYIKDPLLDTKIFKDGTLYEIRPFRDPKDPKKIIFKRANLMFTTSQLSDAKEDSADLKMVTTRIPVITQTSVRYSEKPKMIFLVTPPHLMSYAKIILILLKQLVDLNFDQSYMTKSSQKPLYMTRYMLDELGNLQSDKNGIENFPTMLSIGLGQDQQFTLILQTLQQLRDVYGDSADKIIQGNTSNIVFLKSTDDSMIETLSKMSGKTHKARISSKTVTNDTKKLAQRNEGKVSYTMSTSEEQVISYNDLAFIAKRNSIVFRAGDSPIWNRNETILPMSWKLLGNPIIQPGHNYNFQTIPTLSSARDFDVRHNQPNFDEMLKKRMQQALLVKDVEKAYMDARNFDDHAISMLDPTDYSDDIMTIINRKLAGRTFKPTNRKGVVQEAGGGKSAKDKSVDDLVDQATTNDEQIAETKKAQSEVAKRSRKIFAKGMLSPNDLVDVAHHVRGHVFDKQIIQAFRDCIGDFKDDRQHFIVTDDGSLKSADNGNWFILAHSQSEAAKTAKLVNEKSQDKDSNVYADEDVNIPRTYEVTDDFYRYLASLPDLTVLAHGAIDNTLYHSFDMTETPDDEDF